MNLEELDRVIKRERRKQYEIENALGISHSAWWKKTHGKNEITLKEMKLLISFLRMNKSDIMLVFF